MENITLLLHNQVVKNLVEIINGIWSTEYDTTDLKTISLEQKRFDLKFYNGKNYSVSYKIFAEYIEDSDFNAILN